MIFFKHNIYKIGSSVLYLVVGLLLIFTDTLLPASSNTKQILGIVVLAYGLFRAVTAYTAAKKNKD